MPELPDLTAYVEALDRFISGRAIKSVRTATPFLVRTWDPPLSSVGGRRVLSIDRVAKRIVIGIEDDLFLPVHGKSKQPCPRCATPIQRIACAENECNYCPTCQTGGKLLADRGLSRLLRGDWPKSLEEMEEWKAARRE